MNRDWWFVILQAVFVIVALFFAVKYWYRPNFEDCRAHGNDYGYCLFASKYWSITKP